MKEETRIKMKQYTYDFLEACKSFDIGLKKKEKYSIFFFIIAAIYFIPSKKDKNVLNLLMKCNNIVLDDDKEPADLLQCLEEAINEIPAPTKIGFYQHNRSRLRNVLITLAREVEEQVLVFESNLNVELPPIKSARK